MLLRLLCPPYNVTRGLIKNLVSPYIKLDDELPQDVPPHLATTQLSLLEKITPILPFGRGWNKPLLRFCHYSSRRSAVVALVDTPLPK